MYLSASPHASSLWGQNADHWASGLCFCPGTGHGGIKQWDNFYWSQRPAGEREENCAYYVYKIIFPNETNENWLPRKCRW